LVYSKKALREAKARMEEQSPGSLKDIRKTVKKSERKVIKKEGFEKRKKVYKYNFKVNEIVKHKRSDQIGLVISNTTYFGKKVQTDYYFVFMGNAVIHVCGSTLRKII
tara:strand:+ start:2472 stop:2795 length:324 start_codon:yes stop_codon:yes gene_type:complete